MGRLTVVTDALVYAHRDRADAARALLGAACSATGLGARLDLYATGSLYQRLGARRAQPMPDIVWWFGPFAAAAAAVDGFLQPYQPPALPEGAAHHDDWKWTALEYAPIGVVGDSVSRWEDLASVPRLAVADPERSEVGLIVLLASLDRARQADGDLERGWAWWQQRASAGLTLTEDDATAVALVQSGQASHALTLSDGGTSLLGLAPIPHVISLAAASRNADLARRMLDWATSEAASANLAMSAWRRDAVAALQQAAPPLDVDWGRQQYVATRQRWAASGFGPSFTG
jgi:ABC-type Fe3+ transport system substrate-binding protein